jgi:predicted RNA-binding Zn ribbon-like protein
MAMTFAQFLEKGHGKTAPWVDLVNSEEWDTFGKRTDWLDESSWLPYFLRRWQFPAPRRASFPAASFRALRAILRKCCDALCAGRGVSAKELGALNSIMNVAGKQVLIQRQNGLRVEFIPAARGWHWVLAQIALSFAELLAAGDGARVKVCRNVDCLWVFYDSTKGKTRRWCSDKVCGNRDRVRRARSKAAR